MTEETNNTNTVNTNTVNTNTINTAHSNVPQLGQVNQEQIKAIQVFIQAVNVAQKRGAYNLDEAEIINQAVKQFVVKETPSQQDEGNVNTNDTTPKVI